MADFEFSTTFDVDPLKSSAFGLLIEKLGDNSPLIGEAEEVIQNDIDRCFRTESDPSGSPWPALAEKTIIRKKLKGAGDKGMLEFSGNLRRNTVAVVSGKSRIDVVSPEVGRYHFSNEPRKKIPLRRAVPNAQDLTTGKVGREIKELMKKYATQTRGRGFSR